MDIFVGWGRGGVGGGSEARGGESCPAQYRGITRTVVASYLWVSPHSNQSTPGDREQKGHQGTVLGAPVKHSSWSGVSTLELPYRSVGRSPSPAHGRRSWACLEEASSLCTTQPSGDTKTTVSWNRPTAPGWVLRSGIHRSPLHALHPRDSAEFADLIYGSKLKAASLQASQLPCGGKI